MSIDPNGIPRYAEYPAELDPPELDGDPVRPATERLRELALARGLEVRHGWSLPGGRRVDDDRVTTVYAVPGDPASSLTFEEDEDGNLWCADDMSPRQALGAVLSWKE